MRISVLGAGAWGTAIAQHATRMHRVMLWCRGAETARALRQARENVRYLPGIALDPRLEVTERLERALGHAQGEDALIVLATPMSGVEPTLGAIAAAGGPAAPLIWLCKGIDARTGRLAHELARALLPQQTRVGALSGPSFALEVARGLPVALTVASDSDQVRLASVAALHFGPMRIYGSPDVIGVELGGALKNVMAIAAGASDGLGLGLNARAALITRGLAEITRLGTAMGARAETFTGLAGLGDLVLTCTGDLSRNRRVGLGLARGESLESVLEGLGHVAEGVQCARAARELARSHRVEMPIVDAVCAALFGQVPVPQAVERLLTRDPRDELQ
ncbi:MAG: NAD(P)-dependent glycerol-3-phosphate dehydrogenase [Burkholderiales bacterium]|nr:MAG: NAD(P)-dependent glycerol-3-phosphate dehydrogenase [Burkholderiales bacterium]